MFGVLAGISIVQASAVPSVCACELREGDNHAVGELFVEWSVNMMASVCCWAVPLMSTSMSGAKAKVRRAYAGENNRESSAKFRRHRFDLGVELERPIDAVGAVRGRCRIEAPRAPERAKLGPELLRRIRCRAPSAKGGCSGS